VPTVMDLFERIGVSIIATYATSCILIMLAIMFIPETYGIPPP
jgi:hypothetical protein